ncbi:MAG: FAD-dependent oxidoreductase [Clostridia bacterium]|nr:FAD-dependent oxidoreductase [Clostridia bacterium]MDD4799116.1 FAD-dependent oxidoreductase [Clostridia bacterium]
MQAYDIAVIGGGPAGMAAALAAWGQGIKRIIILERNNTLGGILNQCIHPGFGLQYFNKDLTGPEYAGEFMRRLNEAGIEYKVSTTVLNISADKVVTAVNSNDGLLHIEAKSIILAMGCRERAAGGIAMAGTRPAGVITAGTAQKMINLQGKHIGNRIVVLGSGDIGLIMARRLSLEGKEVLAVLEQYPYANGLSRNVVQCLEDYNIPLLLSHTVTEVIGQGRVSAVKIARVDQDLKPIAGSESIIECDTLLLSVGLIPENELSKKAKVALDQKTGGPLVNQDMQTDVEGIFACGNVVQVHDIVDFVTLEAEKAGQAAAAYIKEGIKSAHTFVVTAGDNVRFVVPQRLSASAEAGFFLRSAAALDEATIVVSCCGRELVSVKRAAVKPSEMESICLKKELLTDLPLNSEILVEIKGRCC